MDAHSFRRRGFVAVLAALVASMIAWVPASADNPEDIPSDDAILQTSPDAEAETDLKDPLEELSDGVTDPTNSPTDNLDSAPDTEPILPDGHHSGLEHFDEESGEIELVPGADIEKVHEQMSEVPGVIPPGIPVDDGPPEDSEPGDPAMTFPQSSIQDPDPIGLVHGTYSFAYWMAWWTQGEIGYTPGVPCISLDPPDSNVCIAGGNGNRLNQQANVDYTLGDYPHRTIAQILYYDTSQNAYQACSGWMLNRQVLVTKGHCLKPPKSDDDGWDVYNTYTIRIAYDHANRTAAYTCGARNRSVPIDWGRSTSTASNTHDYNFGVIRLDCTTSGIGYMGYFWTTRDDEQYRRNYGWLSGHPGFTYQYRTNGFRTAQTAQRIFYDNVSDGGVSGGPRWNTRHDTCGVCVHAIHTHPGSGVLINETVFDLLYHWRHVW